MKQRKLSDHLTKELSFLNKIELNKISEQLGISKMAERLDWFDLVKFLSSEYEDKEIQHLISQYQENEKSLEEQKKDEQRRKELLISIRRCYDKTDTKKTLFVESKKTQKIDEIVHKKGRKKGSGQKEKLFKLFKQNNLDYDFALKSGFKLKLSTFNVYLNEFLKLKKINIEE